jgi:hypothetical protein
MQYLFFNIVDTQLGMCCLMQVTARRPKLRVTWYLLTQPGLA